MINIAPGERHAAASTTGATMVTIFVPGGFDLYLAEVAGLIEQGDNDDATLTALGNRYDIWPDI